MVAKVAGQSGEQRQNVAIFTLPDLPPSINDVMAPARASVHSNKPRWEIKTEWKMWRSGQQRYVKRLAIAPGSLVRVDLWFFYDWYYKNGDLKRIDSQNLIKFAIDTIAMKQDWDDKVCKSGSWGSTHDAARPRVVVRLTEIPDSYSIDTSNIKRIKR